VGDSWIVAKSKRHEANQLATQRQLGGGFYMFVNIDMVQGKYALTTLMIQERDQHVHAAWK
jgi:hypothetical protein